MAIARGAGVRGCEGAVVLALALALALTGGPVSAQTSVSPADIERLQESVTLAGQDIAALRGRDPSQARSLQLELNELQDEVIYLKVKLRKERSLPLVEYTELRDRLESLKTHVRGDEGGTGGYATRPAPAAAAHGTPGTRGTPGTAPTLGTPIPVGTELDVRLQTPLNSGTAQIEDRFEATTLVDLRRDGRMVIPAGSVARGVVTAVKAAGRVDRKGSLSLAFERITVNGVTYQVRGTLVQAIESAGVKADAGKIGAGAAVGGVLGGILGGWQGSLAGILLGGGGTMVATEGQQVDLKPGTVLRMRFDQELIVQ
jgi:hypothetical protein